MARILGLLTFLLGVAVAANGYLVFRAFHGPHSEAHFRIVLGKPEASQECRDVVNELRGVPGVTVAVHDESAIRRKPTGRFWLGLEMDTDMARQIDSQLRGLKFPVTLDTVDGGHGIVRLTEEFRSESSAARARPAIQKRALLTLKVMPAFRTEKVSVASLDVGVPDAERLRTVQVLAGKHDLPLTPLGP